MTAIISLGVILVLSLVVTRMATILLVHTGMSKESARFQARSAFTGVGFTTSESESIVTHPGRRRIILTLMLFGNAGIISVVASVLLTFIDKDSQIPMGVRLLFLLGIVFLLALVSASKRLDSAMSVFMTWFLKKIGRLELQDYNSLLHLSDDHRIIELRVESNDWLTGKTLFQLELSKEGVIIIGIKRSDGRYVGAPNGSTKLLSEDRLLVYGRIQLLKELTERHRGARGDAAHSKAVAEQDRISNAEFKQDTILVQAKSEEIETRTP